jgi:hypothetical protein
MTQTYVGVADRRAQAGERLRRQGGSCGLPETSVGGCPLRSTARRAA